MCTDTMLTSGVFAYSVYGAVLSAVFDVGILTPTLPVMIITMKRLAIILVNDLHTSYIGHL